MTLGVGRELSQRALVRLAAKAGAVKVAVLAGGLAVVFLFSLALIAVIFAAGSPGAQAGLSCKVVGHGQESPPANLIPLYEAAAARYRLGVRGPAILAAINFVETSFGTNMATSSAGANGWMAFLPSTWAEWGVDGDGDGDKDPYSAPDAIFSAANYLRDSGAPGNWHDAIFAYNHAEWYVEKVEREAAKFGGAVVCRRREAPALRGAAELRQFQTLYQPRSFRPVPASLWVGGGAAESVDARIWADVVWVLQTFHLRVTAARETGHNTHGDGTAVDLVPAAGVGWEQSAQAAAEALGWRASCGSSGTAPVCPLGPAIQFVGYNGYPGHGDPLHAGDNAHLHISWQGSSFGSAALSSPPDWVRVFPLR